MLARLEADSDLVCQSGARWEDINAALKEKGIPLFFPVSFSLMLCCTVLIFGSWIPGLVQ